MIDQRGLIRAVTVWLRSDGQGLVQGQP